MHLKISSFYQFKERFRQSLDNLVAFWDAIANTFQWHPKTRSGKIMRRILRKVAQGEPDKLGYTNTVLDPGVEKEIIEGAL